MKFRFTIEELQNENSTKYLSDLKMLRALIAERKSECSNVYSPLAERLGELYNKINKKIEAGQTEIE